MTAKDEAIAGLRDSGLLDVLAWAAPAAFAATDQLYEYDAGHDQGVVGYLNFKHLKDLIDRATSNGRFRLGEGVDGSGSDVVARGIEAEVFRSMPILKGGLVERSDYQQSPGWAAQDYRVLLQSFRYGEIDDIKWGRRSNAKRLVAAQHFVESDTLFTDEEFGLETLSGIPDDDAFEGLTLIAAHSFNPATKQFELYVGQSKNPEHPNDSCWYWKHLLLSGGTPTGGLVESGPSLLPGGAASIDAEDISVRIKKPGFGEDVGAVNV